MLLILWLSVEDARIALLCTSQLSMKVQEQGTACKHLCVAIQKLLARPHHLRLRRMRGAKAE
jgi:hypothetical protein